MKSFHYPPRILRLTLSAGPFEVMATGEKTIEYRKPSQWIKSRLYGKSYDFVEFSNGYGPQVPRCTAVYLGWDYFPNGMQSFEYSNGFKHQVFKGDIRIFLGEILSVSPGKTDAIKRNDTGP